MREASRLFAEQEKQTTPRPSRTAPAADFYRRHDAPERSSLDGGCREWHPYVFSDKERDVVRGALVREASYMHNEVGKLLGNVWPDWNQVTPTEMVNFAKKQGLDEATCDRIRSCMEIAAQANEMLDRMDKQERQERGF